jgi:hypothetical protein
MTCEECRGGLATYAGRQLPSAEQSAIAEHLGECANCRRELEEEITFARQVHNVSVPFRQATLRIQERLEPAALPGEHSVRRFGAMVNRIFSPRKALAAGLALCVLVSVILVLRGPDRELEQLSSWAVDHFPLIDQTHPIHGDARTVQLWFREHHQIDVLPPREADYAALTGCKMAEIDSEPAPLLRFEGKDTTAVFMLPGRFRNVALSGPGTFRKGEYIIRVWSEEGVPYLRIMRDAASGT